MSTCEAKKSQAWISLLQSTQLTLIQLWSTKKYHSQTFTLSSAGLGSRHCVRLCFRSSKISGEFLLLSNDGATENDWLENVLKGRNTR